MQVTQAMAAKTLIGTIWDNIPKGGNIESGKDLRNAGAEIVAGLYPQAWAKRDVGRRFEGHEPLDIITFTDGSQMALNEHEVCEYPLDDTQPSAKSMLDQLFGRAN